MFFKELNEIRIISSHGIKVRAKNISNQGLDFDHVINSGNPSHALAHKLGHKST